MRVALFSDTSMEQVNGVAIILLKMKDFMDRSGIEYRFFTPGKIRGKDAPSNIIKFPSFGLFFYPECKIAIPGISSIKKELDDFKPDLIHLVTEFSLGLAGQKYGVDHQIPMVSSFHTNIPQYLKYYHVDFLRKPLWSYFRWFHSRCTVNFCPSVDTQKELKSQGFANPLVLGNGIDTEKFNPGWRDRKVFTRFGVEDEKILLYVGRISPEKDLEVLLEAVESLCQRGLNYKLLVVGDGPSRKQLELKNVPNTVFTGYVFGEELQKMYASADIFVFPSHTETFGNVVMEAMASGLPVIAAYGGGVKDNLVDMHNGLAFEPGNKVVLADCMEKLLSDIELRELLANNARRYSLTNNWDSVFTTLFEKYQEVISDKAIAP